MGGNSSNGKGNLIVSEESEKDAEKDDKIRQLINYGTEIASGAVGGALGFLIGGPVGAVVGGAGAPVAAITLRSIGQEILERQLGPREKVRVGAAFAIAAADIRQQIKTVKASAQMAFSIKNKRVDRMLKRLQRACY